MKKRSLFSWLIFVGIIGVAFLFGSISTYLTKLVHQNYYEYPTVWMMRSLVFLFPIILGLLLGGESAYRLKSFGKLRLDGRRLLFISLPLLAVLLFNDVVLMTGLGTIGVPFLLPLATSKGLVQFLWMLLGYSIGLGIKERHCVSRNQEFAILEQLHSKSCCSGASEFAV